MSLPRINPIKDQIDQYLEVITTNSNITIAMNRNNINFSLVILLLLSAALMQSCADKTVRRFTANVPVYQSFEDFRARTFAVEGPRQIQRPGKIYLYNQYLLVNELLEGVHIFNNADPSNPVNMGFLPVHANMDLAVNNNVLYLDSYTDLLAFDFSNPGAPQYLSRVEDVFSFEHYGLLASYDPQYPAAQVHPEEGIVVGWNVEKTTEEANYSYWDPRVETLAFDNSFTGTGAALTNSISGAGIGGSTARFTVWDNFLYTLEPWEMGVFDLTGDVTHVRDISMNSFCETLFPAEGNLYIGTTTGMLIYSLGSPSNPTFLSRYDHFTSCDPVVVQGDKAFVTLSTGRNCGGSVNVLEVIDISNILAPTLMASYPMTNPKGLGVDDELLFLCDGPDGLKVFDKSDLNAIPDNLISQFPNIAAADVIPFNGTLIMTSEEGIYQYSYLDQSNIVQLSHIPVAP